MIGNLVRHIIYFGINLFSEKHCTCNSCKTRLNSFKKVPDHFLKQLEEHDYVHPLFMSETFNYFQYYCPVCFCTDRERLYILYLEEHLKTITNNDKFNFLDIAPAKSISNWIKKHYSWINYRTVDLYMKNVDDKADITDLYIYPDEKFDFILCSHVLEHIENDRKALSEIYRILKPYGVAIIMVPVLLSLEKDLENSDYKTEGDRWKYYGQNDHVRMYSKNGLVSKLQDTGFKVMQLTKEFFGQDHFKKYGIHKRSVLYVVHK